MRPQRLALAASLALVGISAPASAFENQWHVGIGTGVAAMKRGDFSSPLELGAELHLTYGLTDMWNLLGEVSISPYVLSGPTNVNPPGGPPCAATPGRERLSCAFSLTTANVGIAYVFDVLRWIPYGGVMAGVGRLAAGRTFTGSYSGTLGSETKLDLVLALGMDYQLTRSWSVGGALRVHGMLLPDDALGAAQVWARLAYTWGW